MKCEVDYCIYNRNFSCILNKIQIDSTGMCEECILISISKEDLEFLKEKQLQAVKTDWM